MIQTSVLAVQEGLLQQVLTVLHTMPTFAAAALPEKLWYQACVPNVLWAKQRLDLLHRAMRVPRANTKIKTIKPVVKLANPGNPPTLLKLDVPDVLQVNIQAMEVVKIVKVDNTKMKRIKATVNLIAMPVLSLIQRKRPATYATLVNTKTTTTKLIVSIAA